jgi:ATP-binding cassette subfamily F protein uup
VSALLSANEIRLSYGYQNLLDGVTLAVAAGEKVGLVGRNGCGKSSLLKILTRQQQADSGEISVRRDLRIGYLPQEFEMDPALTVMETIEQGAADLITAMQRYESGDGTERELVDLLHIIEHADGWNSRHLAQRPAHGFARRPIIGRRKTSRLAVSRASLTTGSFAAG